MDILRQTLFLPYQFPSLNEFIDASRRNKFASGKMKKEWTDKVAWECKFQKIVPYQTPIALSFMWFEPSARRDPDNIIFAKKFILDGLVMAGVIPNDTQQWIRGFNSERWVIVKEKSRVGVQVSLQESVAVNI